MEKFIAVILSLVMALAIVGCSGNANAPAPTTHKDNASFTADGTVIPGSDPKTWGPADESENVQTPNPWQECTSLEEAGKLAGFSFTAPESVDGYTERYIAAIENEIAQVIFSNGDDSELYFRKGVGGDDISGDYNTYDVTEEQTIDGHTVLCKGNDGLIYTATWHLFLRRNVQRRYERRAAERLGGSSGLKNSLNFRRKEPLEWKQ